MKTKGILFGVGTGADSSEFAPKNYPTEYKLWHAMLGRCYYYDNYKNKAIVCDDWLHFPNFARWVREYPFKFESDWHLDKDIIIKGNKIYAPEFCSFVPRRINNAFAERKNESKELPLGVSKSGNSKYKCRYYNLAGERVQVCGFDDPNQAYKCFVKNKERVMRELAEFYRDNLDPRVYNSLITFKQE